MNVRKFSEAVEHKNTSTCIAYEYGLPTSSVDAALIELSGRYPDEGWALNSSCIALVHVVQGSGTISTDAASTELSTDDQVLLMPYDKYALDGTMKLLYIASPAWTPEQAEHVQ